MCSEAVRLIELYDGKEFPDNVERQIILLLNKADSYAEMSEYQLSLARKALGDHYFKSGITGSALNQYAIALELNSKISVKRNLSSLKKIPAERLVYSVDCNIVGEPDYQNLTYHKIELPKEVAEQMENLRRKNADRIGMSLEEYDRYRASVKEDLHRKALEEDSIYDAEFEEMVELRANALGEPYTSEFHRLRPTKPDGPLSAKRLTIELLESMESSSRYKKLEVKDDNR